MASENIIEDMYTMHGSEGYPGYPLKLYFQIPCVFPVRPQIFQVPIYVICEYYIHRTDLADLSSQLLGKKWIFFAVTFAISFTFRIKTFTTWDNKIPCVFPVFWQNFQISCVFPDRDFFLPFSLFSLCCGYPGVRDISHRFTYSISRSRTSWFWRS